MRKTNIMLQANAHDADAAVDDARPGRIQGSTITSWNGPPEIDLAALFAHPTGEATITGGGRTMQATEAQQSGPSTVRLSDGTSITFATAGQFTVMETV